MHPALRDSELLRGRADGSLYLRENATEPYVESPPAYIITDSSGATWTLGLHYIERAGHYEFSVMRNDADTGEMASKIVYQRGKVRIFGRNGWRVWTGKFFI
jgi:hypothetical protein